MRIELLETDGTVRAAGRDLRALQREWASGAEAATVREAAPTAWARSGLTQWDFGDLPERVAVAQAPQRLALYPALEERDGRVDLQLLPPGPLAVARHRAGTRRLLLHALPQQSALIRRQTLASRPLALSYHGIGTSETLVDDLLTAAADECFPLDPPIRTRAAFAAALDKGRGDLVPTAERLRALLVDVLGAYRELRRALDGPANAARRGARDDIAAQIARLIRPGFLTATPAAWRRHLPRYLAAAQLRWQRLATRPGRDAQLQAEARAAEERLEAWARAYPADWPWPDAVVEYRWLLEELRVSLFAQSLGTAAPVSAKRLAQAWERAVASG
jgi:ATP-dependent helicase HrpA